MALPGYHGTTSHNKPRRTPRKTPPGTPLVTGSPERWAFCVMEQASNIQRGSLQPYLSLHFLLDRIKPDGQPKFIYFWKDRLFTVLYSAIFADTLSLLFKQVAFTSSITCARSILNNPESHLWSHLEKSTTFLKFNTKQPLSCISNTITVNKNHLVN